MPSNPVTLEDIGGIGEGAITKAYLLNTQAHTDYIISSPDGTTVQAQSMSERPGFSHASDAAAVMQQAVNALGTAGGTIVLAGNLAWGSVPALPKGITGKLNIRGANTKVTLSAGGPRLFDFNRTADHDTFQNIEISDILVDCNNVDGATHTIIGTRNNVGTSDLRVNLQNISIRRVRATNIPATATVKTGISLATRQAAGGEGTQNFIKDVLIEDVVLEGGTGGFFVTGSPSGAITNLNILIDNIRLIRCKHVQQTATVVPVSSASFQIGQNGPVGYVLIRDCYGEYSADVGLEIDNANEADIEDCVMSNCHVGYLFTNFATPTKANAQRVAFVRCAAVVSDGAVATSTRGFNLIANNSVALGNVIYQGCVFHHSNNVFGTTQNTSPIVFGLTGTMTVRRLSIIDCRVNFESINWNNAANMEPIRVVGHQSATLGLLEIRGLDVRGSGTISGAGQALFRCIAIEGSAAGSCQLRVDGLDIDWNITGLSAGTFSYGFFIVPGAAHTVGGCVRRLRIISLGSDSSARAVRLGTTTNLTIGPAPLTFEECDFSGMSAGGNEFASVDATQAALGAVLTRSNRWKTKPVPVGLTGLVTATGKRLGAQSNAVVWQALAVFTQGSGAAITAVDFSTNDGTTYTNFLTQASAALPAGFDQTVGPLAPADLIKVTFTTTQPTITLVPVNP